MPSERSEQGHADFPSDIVDLQPALVSAVRELLRRGLDDQFMRSCVRIGDYVPFSGGLKADKVGGLQIDIAATLKVGDAELDLHRTMMDTVNTGSQTFAMVLDVVRLPDDRRLMIMEELRKHSSLLQLVYERSTPPSAIGSLIQKAVTALEEIHAHSVADDGPLCGLERTADPYAERIRRKLETMTKLDSDLYCMWASAGCVNGRPLPPLTQLLGKLESWLQDDLARVPLRLVHGDPHLGNIMARRRGKGFSLRLIDPNPTIGFSDPLYDVGKLYHWADPVGWAKVDPGACMADWRPPTPGTGWLLSAHLHGVPKAAEARRIAVVDALDDVVCRKRARWAGDWQRRLLIARAAAHLGLAPLLHGAAQADGRRFVVAHALALLADWFANVAQRADPEQDARARDRSIGV